jgi:outer membrane protein assembly factor BamA
MVWLLAFALLLQNPAARPQRKPQTRQAQPRPEPAKKTEGAKEEPKTFPLESMRVEGNVRYPADRILALTGLKIGETLDPKVFEEARDRIVASGAFETVGYSYAPAESGKGYALTIEVAEIAQVFPVRFDRIDAPEAELRAWLKKAEPLFGDSIPATKKIVDRYVNHLDRYFASKGQDIKIAGRVTSDNPAEPYVLFHPAGAPPVIAQVRFLNSKILPAEVLQRALTSVAVGTEFREGTFRQVLDATIRPLYEERGRIRVAFPNITTGNAPEVKGVAVTIEVDEGPSYDIRNFRVDGTSRDKELLEVADVKTGDIFNRKDLEMGRQRVETRMKRLGYMRVRSTFDRTIDDEARKVDVVLHIQAGQLFNFGKLEVKGIDINGEAALRKMWAMESGKPYNPEYPNYFLERIRTDGLFDNLANTRADLKIDDKTGTVDVTLVFYR